MLEPIVRPQTPCIPTRALFVLVLDAGGNPLVLAPLGEHAPISFPLEQIRPVNGELVSQKTTLLPGRRPEASILVLVESALKRLYDHAFMSEHPLAWAMPVTARMDVQERDAEFVVRARILRALMLDMIEQLRPVGQRPGRSQIPGREWHPYLILHCAYVEDVQNYQIMNWLQISEGTFNRTRRRALQAIAKIWVEFEHRAG